MVADFVPVGKPARDMSCSRIVSGDGLRVGEFAGENHLLHLNPRKPLASHVLFLVLAVRSAFGEFGCQHHPAALTTHAGSNVEPSEHHHGTGGQSGLLAQFTCRQLDGFKIGQPRCGALGELPAPFAHGVAVLFDEPQPIAVRGDDQRVGRLVDHAVHPE